MSIRRSSLIYVAYLQVYERVADNRWWPNIGGLLYEVVPGITVHACDNEKRPGYHLTSWSADKKADSRQTQNVQCRK